MKTIISDITSRKAFIDGKETLEVGYPWLTLGAIMALESILGKNFKVLEFGSGGSTVFFAGRVKSVKSFETNSVWYKNVKKRVEGFSNVELTLASHQEIFNALTKEPDDYYDLILVDCRPLKDYRLLLANASIPKIKLGGYMILDNYTRYSLNDFNYGNWKVYTFDEFGYTGQGTRICKKIS